MKPKAVFSTACLPSIEFISEISKFDSILLEACENYVKQTNRNRYHIVGPNGMQSLFIPLVQQHLNSTQIRDVKISYDEPWQRHHWRTITSAYNRSAYFEFYADEFHTVFFKNHNFLFDFNESLLHWIFNKLKIQITIAYTEFYQEKIDVEIIDYRNLSNFKNNTTSSFFSMKKYPQVFEYKNGFIENLSVLDLIFNVGPVAKDYF